MRGVEDAASAAALGRALAGRGLYPLAITPAAQAREERRRSRPWRLGSPHADASEAMATLAALLDAGLPLERGLEVAARGAVRAEVADAIDTARRCLQAGERLADALGEHARFFPGVAVGLIRAGERGGNLAQAVRRAAEHMERERALRARLASAMLYPLILFAAGGAATATLVLFVLPRFVELLGEAGAPLPRSTALLLGGASLLGRIWPLILVSAACLAFCFTAWRRTERGRERIDALLLRLPVLGPLRARRAAVRVARTLGTLVAGGMPLLSALEIVADSVEDAAVAADLRSAREAVRRGEPFSAALRRSGVFPYLLVRLVQVGEETGELEALLDRAAALLETELERRLQRLVALVEPALIVVFGSVVGFTAFALLRAIYGIHAEAF